MVDVRSRPYSRFVPQYRREVLAVTLAAEGLGYAFLGSELGGRPGSGEVRSPAPDYATRIEQPDFRAGIDRLVAVATRQPAALLCRERDPLDCHRFHLICRQLRDGSWDIRHILPCGGVESQATTERRLLERSDVQSLPLFDDHGDALERAYDRWWQKGR